VVNKAFKYLIAPQILGSNVGMSVYDDNDRWFQEHQE